MGYYEDANLEAYVNRVGQKLAAVSDRPDLDWHFHVIDSPEVNAFAIPGGYIYVTRGILAVLNSEAQMAGVLGHEIGHVTARHTARAITRQQLAQVGLGIGSILSPRIRDASGLAQAGLELLFLKYSRGDETQADELGVRYASRAGYDPREIPATYESLKRLQAKSGQAVPNFLATHPDPGSREVTTRQLAEQAIAGKNAATLRVATNEYKRQVDGVVYGEDPRSGFAENGAFYHPTLRFQVRYPSDWVVQNSRQAVYFGDRGQTVAVRLSIVPSQGAATPIDYLRALQSKGVISDSQGERTRIGGWDSWVGQVAVTNQQGTTTVFHLALIAREAGQFYEFLGLPGESHEADFAGIVRSLRTLSDPDKLNRAPKRVRIVEVAQSGATVSSVARGFSDLAVPIDEVAFLNHADPGTPLSRGYLLKIVRPSTSS